MKNESHPLMRALKARMRPSGPAFAPEEGPRTFTVKHTEIPGLPGKKVGEDISVHLHGHIHSQSNDGHAVIHVAAVKPDSTEMTQKQYPHSKTPSKTGSMVTTQESHAP